MMDKKLKAFVINTLRRASFRHKPRGEAKKRYKVKVGEFKTGRAKYGYKCSVCNDVHKAKDIRMDHTRPVISPVDGFTGFDDYVERLFCDESNFRSLCDPCHDIKTSREKDYRVKFRHLNKADEDTTELEKEYEEFIKGYEK